MTSLDVRSNSAVMKRAEQLKRWEESDTNQQPATPRPQHGSRIKFSAGCAFLAACLASDKDEVVNMLEQGADINTTNVDGLTALHQACIDDNLEMVEFLVEHGADINHQDNEGWTPLHATVSCGFVSIARYLVEHGADVAAVNSDGDLAVDLAVDIQHLPMIDFMQKMVAEQQIDCVKARQAEEQQMLSDAKKWLRSDASEVDRPHPKTGHTALHVAAAKGYTKVLSLLLAGRANVDAQDNDGWTALHAAAHWGQKEAAEMLIDAMADIDIRNYSGQTCIDVADHKMVKFLEELRANNKRIKRRPSSQINRISDAVEGHIVDKATTKIIRVEVRPDNNKDHINDENYLPAQKATNDTTIITAAPAVSDDEAPWRRNNLTRGAGVVRTSATENTTNNQVPEKGVSNTTSTSTTSTTTPTTNNSNTETSDVILRRTQSFENDEKKSPPITPPTPPKIPKAPSSVNTTPIRRSFVPPVRDEESETQRKAHAKRVRETRRSTQGVTLDEIKSAEELVKKKNSNINNSNSSNNNNSNSNNVDGVANISNSNFKLEDASSGNTYPPNNTSIIPSAPAVIAAANLSSSIAQRRISTTNTNNTVSSSNANSSIPMSVRPLSAPPSSSDISTTTSLTTTLSNHNSNHSTSTEDNSSLHSSYQLPKHQRISTTTSTTNLLPETTNVSTSTTHTVGTLITNNANNATTTNATNSDNNDNDKENDSRSALAAQSVIQRRRKPKRRSTGVVHIDMEDLDPDRQDSANDGEEKESGSEQKHTARSRVETSSSGAATSSTSSSSSSSSLSATNDKKSRDKTDNDDNIDYKALWEAVKLENEKLKQQLKKKDDEITQTRTTLEKFANTNAKNSLSENEKRERRAMERKLSELEEELKQLEIYKTENLRLKEENGALIRVISKLSK